MKCKVHNDNHRTSMISIMHAISAFCSSARLISAAAVMASGYPSHASQSNVRLPSENAPALRTGKKQDPQALVEAAVILNISDNRGKRAVNDNRKPVTTADIVDLKKSSNAINVLANDSDPDGDGLTLIYALAKLGAVAFTPQGLVGYAQNPGQPRYDRITYIASDGHGAFAEGTVEIIAR